MSALTALRLSVADLLRRPGSRREEEREVGFGDDLAVTASRVPAGSPMRLELRLESVNEGIVLTGRAVAPWRGECRRCLRPVEGTLVAPLQEVFEARPVEGETQRLDGSRIDLEPVVREAVLLELPLAPLCRDDCPGLCPRCGADLAEGPCGCPGAEVDPRWAALDALRLDQGG